MRCPYCRGSGQVKDYGYEQNRRRVLIALADGVRLAPRVLSKTIKLFNEDYDEAILPQSRGAHLRIILDGMFEEHLLEHDDHYIGERYRTVYMLSLEGERLARVYRGNEINRRAANPYRGPGP